MKVQEYAAKTAEQAIEDGLADLGVTREEAQIEILNEGSLFKKANVRITVLEAATAPSDARTHSGDTPGMRARAFLAETLRLMGIPAEVELTSETDEIVLEIKGETNGLFNRRGDVIDSLQYLSSLIGNAGEDTYHRVVLDSEHFRQQREIRLQKLADDVANKALERGFRIKMDPMNPYERRIIHTYLASRADEVTTHSEGEEPNRFLVVTPIVAKAKSYEPKDEATSDYSSRPPRDGKYHPSSESGRNNRNGGYNRNRGSNGGERGDYNGDRRNSGGYRGNNGDRRNNGGYRSDKDDDRNRGGYGNRNRAPREGENAESSETRPNRPERDFNRDRDRRNGGGYRGDNGRDRDRGGRNDRFGAPKPPRITPTVFGTIITKPIKPTEETDGEKSED